MATGAYDANGIWQYGEDDNIALFSDLLNLATESTSDAFTDDRARLSTLEAGSLAGLIPVVPTSVTAVTGTAAYNSIGTVTFTGCTAIYLNGVFSSTYRNYKIIIRGTSYSTTMDVQMQFSLAGTQSATNYYGAGIRATPGSSAISYYGAGGTTNIPVYPAAGVWGSAIIDVSDPYQARQTNFYYQSTGDPGGGIAQWMNGMHGVSTAYDGIRFAASTGNFTGTISVYGYND